jgi:Family of unknown function (DUF6152)
MRTKLLLLAVAAAFVAAASPVLMAHHAFGAEFDANRPVLLKGKVTKLEWVNPHAWIHLTVVCTGTPSRPDDPVCVGKKAGEPEEWMVEGGTPNTLLRRGITRDSLTAGTEIVVDGYQSKDHTARANGRDVTYPDGRKLFLGSSGTGAPDDEKRPADR